MIIEGLETPMQSGIVTASGMTTVPSGLETPDVIELRKKYVVFGITYFRLLQWGGII